APVSTIEVAVEDGSTEMPSAASAAGSLTARLSLGLALVSVIVARAILGLSGSLMTALVGAMAVAGPPSVNAVAKSLPSVLASGSRLGASLTAVTAIVVCAMLLSMEPSFTVTVTSRAVVSGLLLLLLNTISLSADW